MNKTEFVKAVAKNSGISSRQAYRAVSCVMDTLRVLLSEGEEIEIGGFGTFSVLTGSSGMLYPFFVSSKALNRVLNTPVETGEQED